MKPSLVIFLCILSAAGGVLIGFAILDRYQRQSRPNDESLAVERGQSQVEYKRDVRLRNQENLARMSGSVYVSC